MSHNVNSIENKQKIKGEDIRNLRNSLDYSLAEFGHKIGFASGRNKAYTRGYISNIENGTQEISRDIERGAQNLYRVLAQDRFAVFYVGEIRHLPGQVQHGALFCGFSFPCRHYAKCKNHFIRTSPNQKDCPECQMK